ncbi:N-acetylmuramoyl-L-alanine amidase [Frateuria terrea]|uniref:N-acetylmuramoyl-L-alanine amidase n=1 Tax=Frateuria terrea TaxID=529704 RepID=UPI000B84CECF|nr:N-acetylmuramoyl-L-alanine amidase [Frateuria terrea]
MSFSRPRCATLLRASRLLSLVLLLAGLAACGPVRNPMARWVPSPNYDQRRPVAIVIHFTDQSSVQESLHTLRTANSGGPVSAHYLIGGDGGIYQLVADSNRAWQAGPGRWGTITDLNSASIGIELDNDGHSPFAPAQIDSLLRLLADLTTRLHIPPTQIIGHEDLAPGRKDDPGPLFPWQRLAEAGYGLWPRGPLVDPPPGFDPWMALALVGYPLDDRPAAVRSFHHHFRGMDGDALDTQDLRVLYALSRQLTLEPVPAPGPLAPGAGISSDHE